ncbi:protein of unknown function [Taphrina deformans PYCC 5710]|uniref:Integral membrane protein TmpA n=1 Tax=Taphrina deformans (strain PYCC 5710 / ATCC 11124 / CBS 356.35 / IMI 108563 / JCM 9778 / NBRC 8474) TaxID=1097556 RepID=R4XGN7_TAPDE|nr:protein of unknown function [Taphrina deformans PYCC 5710]|eukprot:CCG84828.1 protein of unknown function [Taphrina deformans PYCC 5710]
MNFNDETHLADGKLLLPIYNIPKGRQNLVRDGAYFTYDAGYFNSPSTTTGTFDVPASQYLPGYVKAGFELPQIKPLAPRLPEDINNTDILIPLANSTPRANLDRMEAFLIWFSLYRKLFALILILNCAGLLAVTQKRFGYAKHNTFTFALGNLLVSILSRNEFGLRILYWLTVRTLFWTPVRIRNLVTALFVNLGGVHSGCATAGLLWTCYAAYMAFRSHIYPRAILSFAILTPIALSISIAVALPYVRHAHHNIFEKFHRFVGWLGLAYLWILVVLLQTYDPAQHRYRPSNVKWATKQEFWMTLFISAMIVSPWLTLQKIPVKVSAPSSKIAFLSFPGGCYTGLLGRLSRSPWLEWHAFGIISEGPLAFTHHMLVVAQGDWTRALISDPPSHIWTRGLKFAGLPYLAEMYDRGVIVATGAGIGVTLSVYLQTKGHFHLIWIGSDMDNTYGPDIMALLRKAVKGDRMTLVDTKKIGRPDTVQLIDNVYRKINAQVVFITSNPKGTELMVNGCRERGMTAFGPLFDS